MRYRIITSWPEKYKIQRSLFGLFWFDIPRWQWEDGKYKADDLKYAKDVINQLKNKGRIVKE